MSLIRSDYGQNEEADRHAKGVLMAGQSVPAETTPF